MYKSTTKEKMVIQQWVCRKVIELTMYLYTLEYIVGTFLVQDIGQFLQKLVAVTLLMSPLLLFVVYTKPKVNLFQLDFFTAHTPTYLYILQHFSVLNVIAQQYIDIILFYLHDLSYQKPLKLKPERKNYYYISYYFSNVYQIPKIYKGQQNQKLGLAKAGGITTYIVWPKKMGSFCVKLLMCWITFLWSCGIQVGYSQYNVYRQDPFAILSRTLLTYQQAACDGQVLNLVCPTSTKISIQLVQYGRTAPSSQVRTFSQT